MEFLPPIEPADLTVDQLKQKVFEQMKECYVNGRYKNSSNG
jgi:hypothetical protein